MAITIDKTITRVVKDQLCTGCGTCVSICPKQCIEMGENITKGIYLPQLEREKCDECGLCLKVCPGHEVNFKKLNLEIFGRESQDILVGNSLSCYLAHATDYDIRYNSASGGLVTALLVFALEEGIIDGALVTRMSKDNPLRPQPFIARTREEIISASKSKYCPVPANIALREIINAKEDEKFAVVGLPCHIHGIRKAEAVNKALKDRIVLHFGLLCTHVPSFMATDFILHKNKLVQEDVKELYYRDEGWLGKLRIVIKSGQAILLPSEYYDHDFGSAFFTPERCTLCYDHTSELADISFGNALLPEIMQIEKVGKSMIICRSKIGAQILLLAIDRGYFELETLDKNKVVIAQGISTYKELSTACLRLLRRFGKPIPFYGTISMKPAIYRYLMVIETYLCMALGRRRFLWGTISIYNALKAPLMKIAGKILRRPGA